MPMWRTASRFVAGSITRPLAITMSYCWARIEPVNSTASSSVARPIVWYGDSVRALLAVVYGLRFFGGRRLVEIKSQRLAVAGCRAVALIHILANTRDEQRIAVVRPRGD